MADTTTTESTVTREIITRFRKNVNGKDYFLGGVDTSQGQSNIVILSSNDTIAWGNYSVSVYDATEKTTQTYTLTADEKANEGTAKFNVPFGHQFTITLPTIKKADGTYYPAPATRTYTANQVLITRYITHSYLTDYEELDIHATVESSLGDDVSILTGKTITVKSGNTTLATGVFDEDGRCNSMQIQYGQSYTIEFPTIDGYAHDHLSDEYTAGVVSREILVTYLDSNMGLFGIHSNGTHYTYDQLSAAITAGTVATTDIVAIGFTNPTLKAADRGDGKTDCGFCIPTDLTTYAVKTYQWADNALCFNPNKMPFVASLYAGLTQQLGGKYNSEVIEQIGDEGDTNWVKDTDKSSPTYGQYIQSGDKVITATPAVDYCHGLKLTINGVERQGFLPSFAQIYYLGQNLSALKNMFTLLGKTAPTITSGGWWTSCQNSETNAVNLGNGGFNYGSKAYSFSVLVCFDL